MEDYSEEEESYDSSQDSNHDETDQGWSSEEDGSNGSWSADEYSNSDYENDPGEEVPRGTT